MRNTPARLRAPGLFLTHCLLALAMLAGTAATVSVARAAEPILSEDFESYPSAASSLDNKSDADPDSTNLVVVDDTPLGSDDGTGVQVISWDVHSGNRALLVRSGSEMQINLPGTRSGRSYELNFWLRPVKGTGDRNFLIVLRGEGSDINGDDLLAFRSDRAATSNFYYYDGVGPGAAAWVNSGYDHAENAWQHYRIGIDPNALNFNLFMDDMVKPLLNGADLSRCEVAVPTQLRIVHEGNSADDGYFIIDDISMTVDGSVSLATSFSEGFEGYQPRVGAADDADPGAPWITTEVNGTGAGKDRMPEKVQVVDKEVVPPHSGNRSLKLEGGQRAGVSLAWGTPPEADVQVTWWARVPASVAGTTANYLRVSMYGAENGNCLSGDNALLGYGSRQAGLGDETSLTYFTTAWVDSGVDFTPDAWEEYRLITHVKQGRYTLIKNPSSANAQVIVDQGPFIGTATNWAPVFMIAWSSSNGSGHPPVYVDDIEIKSLISTPAPLPDPYTVDLVGSRFKNCTKLAIGNSVGAVAVDPRDNSTILFSTDVAGGGIYQARKTRAGTWEVDPAPVVTGLDRPSGLTVAADGTLWWTHDYNNGFVAGVMRLKAPWASNAPEIVIADFGDTAASNRDDDAIDLTFAPPGFDGAIGKPGMLIIADRGIDGDANNAVYYLDPAAAQLAQEGYSKFLIDPTSSLLGSGNLNAIAASSASREVITLSSDGFLSAINADGGVRNIWPSALWADPLGPTPTGMAIAVDPQTSRLWVAEDLLDELWSIALLPGDPISDAREVRFPLTNTQRPDRQLMMHDPGLAFSPDGAFLVLSDASTANGGGRLLVFHNEAIAPAQFHLQSPVRTEQGISLKWEAVGTSKYRVERSTTLDAPSSFTEISGDLTEAAYVDTHPPQGTAFYRIKLIP